jgi:hypothetical protein
LVDRLLENFGNLWYERKKKGKLASVDYAMLKIHTDFQLL